MEAEMPAADEEVSVYAERLITLGFRLIPERTPGEDIHVPQHPTFAPEPPWCIITEANMFVTDETLRTWVGPAFADISFMDCTDVTQEYLKYRVSLEQSDPKLH